MLQRSVVRCLLAPSILVVLAGCGGSPTPRSPAPSSPSSLEKKETSADVSPVPAPPGLVALGRVKKPDALVSAAGSWAGFPLPTGSDLVRSITDASVADVVDLSQPVDAAVSAGLSRRGVDPLFAFSVGVKSFGDAKAKLAGRHTLVAREDGSFEVKGLGEALLGSRSAPAEEDEEDDARDACVLAPAARGGRIVCGGVQAVDALAPYMSRTLPRESWPADVHVELRLEPVRAPLAEMRASIPVLARSMLQTKSPAMRDFVDASLGELMDIVNDTQKVSIDARVAESGIVADVRFDFQSSTSTFARMLTIGGRAEPAPRAFWHLPADTDTAFFGRGAEPKLFERMREIVANLVLDATDSAGVPETEGKLLRDFVAERLLVLFTSGTHVYGKGFDPPALEKALAALKVAESDPRARDDAERAAIEQIAGWHLYQVSEPVAKVGPILKELASLSQRPALVKWGRDRPAHPGSQKTSPPSLRIAPMPAGVTLPKGTVHLEVTFPREDLVIYGPALVKDVAGAAEKRAPKAAPAKPKRIARKAVVFHVFAVPDGGETWLAFGLDGKLVAKKAAGVAAASLSSASEANTLGATAGSGHEALREAKLTGGALMTVRGLAVFSALSRPEHSAFAGLGSLPSKGATPIVFTTTVEPPSDAAKAGSSVTTLRLDRGVIEDVLRLATR